MPRFAILTATALAAALLVAPHAHAKKKAKKKGPVVSIKTSMGTITARLNAKKAPLSVENFLKYANDGFYDGTIFHRVIKGFMIQGGGMTPDMKKKKTRSPIKLEAGNGLSNKLGTLAMARTGDPNSATAQFFINVVDNPRLDSHGGGYAVFGKVTGGMDVVEKIKKAKTGTKSGRPNVPAEPIIIESVKVVGSKAKK